MAITQVTQVVRGLLGQQFIQATGNLKGALLGTIKGRGRNNAPGGAMENKGRFRTTVLQYPFGVSNDPMQGHYILFKITYYLHNITINNMHENKLFQCETFDFRFFVWFC